MSRNWKTAANENALVPDWTYHVEVCSFTFYFRSLEEVEEYLAYYRQKIPPSSADSAEREKRFHVKTATGGYFNWSNSGDHWERQSRFDELPLYLREEPKRLKVVKALERALQQWRAENDKT